MRKRRTRQHVIEDLSYNFVEKQALLAFCTFERYRQQQYTYDGHIFTFAENGEMENEVIFVQVKATDSLKYSKKHKGYQLRIDTRDMELWGIEGLPILLVLYDAKNEVGYFIEMGEYFRKNRQVLKNLPKFRLVFLSPDNHFTPEAIKIYQAIKNQSYYANH